MLRSVPLYVLQVVPAVACAVGCLSTHVGLYINLLFVCAAICVIAFGELVRRVEAAAARVESARQQLENVHHVGHSSPQEAMRAAARWGSDVLGRVARGQDAAVAVANAPLVEADDARERYSDAGSAVSEQELNGLGSSHHQGNHSSWIYNAIRSVTPDHVTPRDVARMGTVPEDVPYYGQPLARAHAPQLRRRPVSPPRAS